MGVNLELRAAAVALQQALLRFQRGTGTAKDVDEAIETWVLLREGRAKEER